MSIQQEIIDTIGAKSVEVGALRTAMGNVGASELDVALNALLRARRIRVVCNRYEVIPSTRPLGGMPHTGRPPSAEEEAAASLQPQSQAALSARSLKRARDIKVSAPIPEPPEDNTAASQPVVADRVFDIARTRRQAALNKVTRLKVDLANAEAEVAECDTFLAMYERFAEGQ